eukprot:scaffold14595_cov68-Phaeocystis_antarctica.AAC.3
MSPTCFSSFAYARTAAPLSPGHACGKFSLAERSGGSGGLPSGCEFSPRRRSASRRRALRGSAAGAGCRSAVRPQALLPRSRRRRVSTEGRAAGASTAGLDALDRLRRARPWQHSMRAPTAGTARAPTAD